MMRRCKENERETHRVDKGSYLSGVEGLRTQIRIEVPKYN